jgi:phage terminase Nu1 subunit (DNA packaging protein)
MKPVTKAELARRLHVHKSTISGYIRRGLPVKDGRVDPALAADWIKQNVHAQAGSRGAGVRGAAELAGDPEVPPGGDANSDLHDVSLKPSHGHRADLLQESIRLARVRADHIELKNRQLEGGSDSERQRILADTIALNCWWAFQRLTPWTLEATIADLSGVTDPSLRYLIRDYILGRDQELARRLRTVIRDGISGRLETVRGELQGPPWVEPKMHRNSKADAVAARASKAEPVA